MREVCYLHLTRWLADLLDRKDRMSMASGLEVRVPFCDHRLVEYVFNTSWAFKTFDGREKSLLRAAVADVVPEPILRKAPVAPLLDSAAVKEITTAAAPKTTSTVTRMALETTLDLNAWLEAYSPRIDI